MTDKDIIELINRFEGSDISRLKIKDKDFSIELEREFCAKSSAGVNKEKAEENAAPGQLHLHKDKASYGDEESLAQADEADRGVPVKAPLAGVFYSASKPGAAAYVKEGQQVKKGDILGLVEAMKMMNEITAPSDGRVKSINVKNETFVQFNETIMILE